MVEVGSVTFKGTRAIKTAALAAALATRASDRLPWGTKRHFDRARFDADIKRVEAFYADRGYPDARVISFDVRLNTKQDKVDVTITVSEGEPVRVRSVRLEGFEVVPPDHLTALDRTIPLEPGDPRDRLLVAVTRERSANELKDHGFPYAQVMAEEQMSDRQVDLVFRAQPGTQAKFGPVEISGYESVSEEMIRRVLAFHPGDLYRRSLVQESQRRLYAMELFQFVTIETRDLDRQSSELRAKSGREAPWSSMAG